MALKRRKLPARKKPSTKSKSQTKPRRDSGGGKTPNAFSKANKEQKDRKRKKELRQARPFEFWLADGETREIIVLDYEDPFYAYEHSTWPKKGDPIPCIKETELCPACDALDNESYWFMALTVLDVKAEWIDKKTRETKVSRFQKKTFKVKSSMSGKFERLFRKKGTFRGMRLSCTRDGDKAARTGNDIEFIGFVSEQKLKAIAKKYQDKEAKESLIEPMDYEKAFPEVTADEIRAMLGSSASRGRGGIGREDFDDDEDDTVDEDFDVDLDD